MTGDPPTLWWERLPGAGVVFILCCVLTLSAIGLAFGDPTGGTWMAVGMGAITVGLTGANFQRAMAAYTAELRRMARQPGRPYDWGREPADVTDPADRRAPINPPPWHAGGGR